MSTSRVKGPGASYDVGLTSSAAKELKKLSAKLIARIVPRLENLASNPRPPGCKKLQGGDREWRIRVGDYRAVYTVDDAKLLVRLRASPERRTSLFSRRATSSSSVRVVRTS
jgi:mRNA interferase RelE/StbE